MIGRASHKNVLQFWAKETWLKIGPSPWAKNEFRKHISKLGQVPGPALGQGILAQFWAKHFRSNLGQLFLGQCWPMYLGQFWEYFSWPKFGPKTWAKFGPVLNWPSNGPGNWPNFGPRKLGPNLGQVCGPKLGQVKIAQFWASSLGQNWPSNIWLSFGPTISGQN